MAIAAKEALHIRRDPRTLALALAMPVILLVLLGYGVRLDLDELPLAVLDRDNSADSRELVRAMAGGGSFAVERVGEEAEVGERFGRGVGGGALFIPPGYGRSLARGESSPISIAIDGSDPMVASQVQSKVESIVQAHGAWLMSRSGGRLPIEVTVMTRYNPQGRSVIFMLPGVLASVLALVGVMLTALSISGERERGSMEQLFASPVSRLDIVLGKLIPYVALGFVSLLMVIAAGLYLFDAPLKGSLPLALLLGLLCLLCMLSLGLLISVSTSSQLVATQAAALASMLPSFVLSGAVFPISNMPLPLRLITAIVPARYLVEGLRSVMLKGVGLSIVWPDLLAMSCFSAALLAIATARFKRRVA